MPKNNERIAAFIFGLVFLVAILATTVFLPEPTPYQYTVFRIVLSLSAAGATSLLPGFLQVEIKLGIRAGGAMGVFLIVYFFAPAALSEKSAEHPVPAAYQAVFGPRPDGATTPPLMGAKLSIGHLRNAITDDDSASIVKLPTLKILVAYYIDSPCKSHLFNALLFAEGLSPFIPGRIDVLIFNVRDGKPPIDDIKDFYRRWHLGSNVYFLYGSESELQTFALKTRMFVSKRKKSESSSFSIDYTNIALIYGPDGNPGWYLADNENYKNLLLTSRSILYYVYQHNPEWINRNILSPYLFSSSIFASPAYAEDRIITLDESLKRARLRREGLVRAEGIDLRCNHPATH